MCRPASFVVTKSKVYFSTTTESHSDIITEFGLKEVDVRSNYQVVCVEITPPGDNFCAPLQQWEYHLDNNCPQDKLPEWYDAEKVEGRCRIVLKQWVKAKLITKNTAAIRTGQVYICGSAVVKEVYGSAVVERVFDLAVVKEVGGSAVVEWVSGSAVVKWVYGSAVVERVGDSAVVEEVGGSAVVKRVGGSAVVERVGDSAVVERVFDLAVVKEVGGSAVVEWVSDSATIINYGRILKADILKSNKAVLVDRSGAKVRCYIGEEMEAEDD